MRKVKGKQYLVCKLLSRTDVIIGRALTLTLSFPGYKLFAISPFTPCKMQSEDTDATPRLAASSSLPSDIGIDSMISY
jgi:hypothetical protein